MKTLITLATVLVASTASVAFADNITCTANHSELKIRLNVTDDGAVLVLSDASVSGGRKTIARFEESKGTLRLGGSVGHDDYTERKFEAVVDRRFNDSNRDGELLMGTRLGEVKSIQIRVRQPEDSEGDDLTGDIRLTKRNGQKVGDWLDCSL